MKEPFKFVGYWNGDTSEPIISTNIDSKDKTKKLCIITVEEVPDSGHSKLPYDINGNILKLTKELKNLTKATKRLK